jgi:hypothetical protein
MGPHDCGAPMAARLARSKEVLSPLLWKPRLYMSSWKLSLLQRRLASSLQRRGAIGITTRNVAARFPLQRASLQSTRQLRIRPSRTIVRRV